MLYYIYKITVGDKIYIGSTKDIYHRLHSHKSISRNENHRQHHDLLYVEIRTIKLENCKFEVIREIDVINKEFARNEEQKEIDKYEKTTLLNINSARPTKEQQILKHRQRDKEYRDRTRKNPEKHALLLQKKKDDHRKRKLQLSLEEKVEQQKASIDEK